MAATIDIKLDDNSKEWTAEIKRRFLEAGGSADKFDDHLEALNKELSGREAQRAAQEIKKLADEYESANRNAHHLTVGVKGVGNAIDQTGNAAKVAGDNMRRGGAGFAANMTAMSTGVMALIGTAKQLVEIARKAYQGIAMMAETSPKFGELKAAIDGVGESMQKAARSFASTDFGAGAIDAANKKLRLMGEGVEALPELWQSARAIALEAQLQMAEAAGLNTDKIRKQIDAIRDENAANKEKVAQQKLQAEIAASTKIAAAADAAVKKAEDQAEFGRNLQKLNNQERIEKAIAKEREARAELVRQGKLTEELAQESAQRILALGQQKLKAIDAEIARQKELTKSVMDGERNKFLAIEARKDAEKAEEQSKIDKIKQAMGMGDGGGMGGGQQGPDMLGQLQGGMKPFDVRNRVIKDRQEKALRQWREQMQGEGKMDQNGMLLDRFMGTSAMDDGQQDFRNKARTKAQERAILERIRRQARKDFNLGNVSEEESARAGGELLQESAQNLMQGGKFDNAMVGALEQSVQGLRQTREEKAQLTDTVKRMQNQLKLIMGRQVDQNFRDQNSY